MAVGSRSQRIASHVHMWWPFWLLGGMLAFGVVGRLFGFLPAG